MQQGGNPFDQFDEQDAGTSVIMRSKQADAAKSEAGVARDNATLPVDLELKRAQATLARIKAKEAQDAADAKNNPQAKAAASGKAADTLAELLLKIQAARGAITPMSTGIAGQITQGVWGSDSASLDAALKAVLAPSVIDALKEAKAQSKTGASGFGALSGRELSLLEGLVANLSQKQDEKSLRAGLDQFERHYRRFSAYNAGVDPDTPEGAQWAGLAAPAEPGAPLPGSELSGDVSVEKDPTMAGLNSIVLDMLKLGRTPEQIRSYLNAAQPGLGDRVEGLDEGAAWMKGPHNTILPKVDLESKIKPNTGVQKVIGSIADSPFGAAAIGAGDVASMGLLDELSPNADMSRAVLRGTSDKYPTSFFAGQALGGIGAGMGAEGLAAKYGLKFVPGLTDLALSAGYGAGSADPEHRVAGAIGGGLTGYLGGKAVRGTAKGVGYAMKGPADDLVTLLDQYGVRMTPGQMLGGGFKAAEDKFMSMPVVGDMIKGRRREGFTSFNQAAFTDALKSIKADTGGEIGESGVARAQQAVADAYKAALDGVTLKADAPFVQVVRGVPRAAIDKIRGIGPELGSEIDDIITSNMDPATGTFTGEGLQTARQQIRDLRLSLMNGEHKRLYARHIAPALGTMEDSLMDLFRRQAPERAEGYLAADTAYKHVAALGEAVADAAAASDGIFTPAQLNAKAKAAARKFGGKAANARGERPFFELARAGRTTLPSTVPDSGTAGRIMLPLMAASLTGGGRYLASGEEDSNGNTERDSGGAALLGLLAAGAVSAPYSRSMNRAIQPFLTGARPKKIADLGELLIKYAPNASRAIMPYMASSMVDRVPKPSKGEVDINDAAIRKAMRAGEVNVDIGEAPPQDPIDLGDSGFYDPSTDEFVLPSGRRVPASQEQ